ncbi:enoyl-CoA hydratase-related protein [Corynebacterium qintianiae]|nr:enoyl-CoA hydratase-related protein [Corynebacterium qintianiae]
MLVTREMVGEVAVLTLNRDEKRNALSLALIDALRNAVEEPGDARALMITGAGSAFSAGADLAEDKVGGDFFGAFFSLVRALRTSPLPVIAYVNGPAIGAGMMLTMACDIRVATPESYFSVPVGDMAIGVDEWVVGTLSSLVGGSRARVMLIAGTALDASEAASCGYCLPGDREAALHLAQTAAAKAPLTVRNIKAEFAPDLVSERQREAARRAPFASSDSAEALRARRERRAPRFTGE